jgi:hypothetical protein
VQVHVELPVGEAPGQPVGGVDRQGGLAHPGRARHRHDRHVPVVVQQGAELVDQPGVADEVARVHRKLRRPDRHRRLGRAGRDHQRGVAGEDGPLEPLELGPGLDAQLLDQPLACPGKGRQRVGLPPAAVQRGHELRPQPLPQRVGVGQLPQLAHQLGVPAQREIGLDAALQRLQALLAKPLHHPAVQHL